MDNKNSILWLQSWYFNNCDGDWEHDQRVIITTIDNPGWSITIKLEGTIVENEKFSEKFVEHSDLDWFCCRVNNKEFLGDGGPHNLLDLISIFKGWVGEYENKESK